MNGSPELLWCLEYQTSISQYHASCCPGWSFKIHLYLQPLEHMATIHLGIALIVNILNWWNKKSLFRAGNPLAKERRLFASHPRGFLFTTTPRSGRWTIFTGLFAEVLSVDQSPPGCWMLINSHLEKFLVKRLYRLGRGENSSVRVSFSYSLSHWDKTFLQGGQIQISFL